MKLLVIRHGIADDADEFAATGRSDDERPLTAKGEREMERVAGGLRAIVERIDLLAPSPLTRARQTAERIAASYGIGVGQAVEALRPTSPLDAFVEWARALSTNDVVAVVGHDPHLARLVTWLCTGVDAEGVALKKGGACLLRIDAAVAPGAATLRWLMTPAQLVGCRL
jgi:phosphohistidine phosphatase